MYFSNDRERTGVKNTITLHICIRKSDTEIIQQCPRYALKSEFLMLLTVCGKGYIVSPCSQILHSQFDNTHWV